MKIKKYILKHNYVIFPVIFLFSSYIHLLQASEPINSCKQLPTINDMLLPNLINDISVYINTTFQYSHDLLLQDKVKIINTISPHCTDTEHTEKLFNGLYTKNSLFKLAADFFIEKAVCNINNVTLSTISSIQCPARYQPTRILNDIKSTILKNFIINCAINRINFSYEMTLNGHTDAIRCFDICTLTHMAITGSKDNTCLLWDLNQGICAAILTHGASFVCFNANGSFFSTLQYYLSSSEPHNTKTIIEQWKIDQSQIAPKITRTHMLLLPDINPYRMAYNKNNAHNILELTHWSLDSSEEPHYHLSLYQFHENNIITLQETKDILPVKRQYQFNSETYSVDFSPTNNSHSITIVKNNCHPLYLCKQAVKNTCIGKIDEAKISIRGTTSYASLTKYEKDTVKKCIQAKKQKKEVYKNV